MSGGFSAHHQEHKNLHTASDKQDHFEGRGVDIEIILKAIF